VSFLIPNAGNTTGGNKFTALDQAEPDSVDFSILGNSSRSGVLSGAAVTANNNATDVAVASGIVVLKGVPYALSASPSLGLPSAPANYRFDLIVARISGSTASLVVVAGANSSTNPLFPASRQLLTGSYSPSANIDFDTDVVLAAVFRDGGAAVNEADILDKRVMLTSTVLWQGAAVPGAGTGDKGNLFLTDPAPSGDVRSGLYVKSSDGWQELVRIPAAGGPFWPVGMVGIWPGKGALPQGFRDAVGEVLSVATYPELFAAYGTDYGGNGTTTFGTPDYRDLFIRGAAVPTDAGATVGQDNITLTTANMPSHDHTMAHSHPIPHTHTNDHTHGPHTTSTNGSHSHGPGTLAVVGVGGRNPMLREPTYNSTNYATGYYTTNDGVIRVWKTVGGDTGEYYFGGGMAISQLGQLVVSGSTTGEGLHDHSITVGPFSGTTGPVSTPNTGSSSAATTSLVGSGTSHTNIPASKKARYVFRAL
jgi:microcystin-dependent protein